MSDLRFDSTSAVPRYYSAQLASYPRLRHGYFTRLGGVSTDVYESLNFRLSSDDSPENVMKNFDLAAESLGFESQQIVRTMQSHTDCIRVVDSVSGFCAAGENTDALVTAKPGVLLAGFYADCQLVMLFDHHARVCALVHAGWRGTANEIVTKTIALMADQFNVRRNDLTAVIGPSICRNCFETDDDVPEALGKTYGEAISDYMYRENGKWHVDLRNITYMALLREGILPMNIDVGSQCTCHGDRKLFWSHRRDGEQRGVHAGMIGMQP